MTVRQRDGDCRAFTKDSSCYSFARECYQPLLDAWMAGKAFYTGKSIYGSPMTVKLSCIEGVGCYSPDIIALADADEREEKQQALLNGDP